MKIMISKAMDKQIKRISKRKKRLMQLLIEVIKWFKLQNYMINKILHKLVKVSVKKTILYIPLRGLMRARVVQQHLLDMILVRIGKMKILNGLKQLE